jgi:hypothetical protein
MGGKVNTAPLLAYLLLRIPVGTTLLLPMLLAVFAGGLLAGERQLGTLRVLLVRPVTRTALLGAKLLADEHDPSLGFLGRLGADALEQVDCCWYVRPRFAFLFEVEWTAMLGEPVLRRGRGIAADERIVRFLVLPPERVELLRRKLEHSPVLRVAMEAGNWHVLRIDALRRFAARPSLALGDLEPYLGLDPVADHPDQLPLFDA